MSDDSVSSDTSISVRINIEDADSNVSVNEGDIVTTKSIAPTVAPIREPESEPPTDNTFDADPVQVPKPDSPIVPMPAPIGVQEIEGGARTEEIEGSSEEGGAQATKRGAECSKSKGKQSHSSSEPSVSV